MMFKSLRDTLNALQQGQLSSRELTASYLQRIEQFKPLNAFISLDADEALRLADNADKALRNQSAKPLTGLPMAHKDLFCTSRLPTTCGSKMLEHFISPYCATVVEKLDQAGCIMLGKTNMDEFAMGSTNESSFFGAVKNPWDNRCVAGGSSGGSAAAVAAGLVAFATASDTGGSIRQPAAFCGVSGIKPTYGLLSRFGMVAYASSLDQAGVIAPSADDLALVLHVMAGFDPRDSTSIKADIPDYSSSLNNSIQGLKIGVPQCFFDESVDPAIRDAISHALKQFEQAGAVVIDIELPLQSLWIPAYYLIACAEASSNLSRFDGVRFGYRSKKAASLREMITASRSEGLGEEVKRRILTGTYALSAGYFDAYYLQALKIRRLIQQELIDALNKVDVILGPTTPTCAFKLGDTLRDPMQNYLADVFTVAANLGGFPALSIPAGFAAGLPVGMQLMGKHFSEARLLNVAHQYQQMTSWHQQKPAGVSL